MTYKEAMMESGRRRGEDPALTIDAIRHADSHNPSFDSNSQIPLGQEENIIGVFHQMQAAFDKMSPAELESERQALVGNLAN